MIPILLINSDGLLAASALPLDNIHEHKTVLVLDPDVPQDGPVLELLALVYDLLPVDGQAPKLLYLLLDVQDLVQGRGTQCEGSTWRQNFSPLRFLTVMGMGMIYTTIVDI